MEINKIKEIRKSIIATFFLLTIIILIFICQNDVIKKILVSGTDVQLEAVLNWLNSQTECRGYDKIIISDIDGNAITSDNKKINISNQAGFIKALNDESSISQSELETIDEEKFIMYSAPIKIDDNIVGVLMGEIKVSKSIDSFSVSFFSGQGYSYILDSKCNIIFHPNKNLINKNLINLIEEDLESEDVDHFIKKINNSFKGASHFTINGEKNYIGYAPILSTGDWSVVSCIPEDIISNKTYDIIKLMYMICVIILIIFIGIIIYIIRSNNIHRKYIDNLIYIDKTTGISNYNKFKFDCEEKLRNKSNENYAVILLDIDNFKIINEILGYNEGTELLVSIAKIISNLPINNYLYGRMTNDHFMIFMEYESMEDIIKIVKYIQSSLGKSSTNKQFNLNIVLSTGIYLIRNKEEDISDIINKANMAKEMIKGSLNERYKIFDDEIKSKLTAEKSIENEINKGLINNCFDVYYQPKVNIYTGEFVGSEALIRWIHPIRGVISPAEFIPIAEKSGIIIDIGKYVLNRVCSDLAYWKKGEFKLLPVSINLSQIELYQADLIESIKDTLHKFNIDGSLLEIEITERIVMSDIESAKKIIEQIKDIGIKISMDDFGTGYSSFSYLKSLPIDVLKIDKSISKDIENDKKGIKILNSIIQLSYSLDLEVIAEGLETIEQEEVLKSLGCDIAQGYLYGKPMTKKSYEDKVIKNRLL